MKVKSMNEAWSTVDKIFPTDYVQDMSSSERAGYPVYRSTAAGHYNEYICDLGDRLEVNLESGETVNIWIDEKPEPEQETTMKVEDLASHFVTGMFEVTARYEMVNEYTGETEYTEDRNLPVEMFRNDYHGWNVTYITIERGTMVIGLLPPQ